MARLIYSMLTSLDGYTEDANGDFGWATPDEELHAFINKTSSSMGIHLYGRRMYEMMIYWETAHTLPDQSQVALDWARLWQEAEKIVYSRTLDGPQTARTRIEKEFDPDAVRRLKESAESDLVIAGPTLAAHAVRAGLVDEIQLFVNPVVVGGGTPFFPEGVRLDLKLEEERGFSNGVVFLRYIVRS